MARVATWVEQFRAAVTSTGNEYQKCVGLVSQFTALGWDVETIRTAVADGGEVTAEDVVAAIATISGMQADFFTAAQVLAKMRP